MGADTVIAAAHFTIPAAILSFVRQRRDAALNGAALLFSATAASRTGMPLLEYAALARSARWRVFAEHRLPFVRQRAVGLMDRAAEIAGDHQLGDAGFITHS